MIVILYLNHIGNTYVMNTRRANHARMLFLSLPNQYNPRMKGKLICHIVFVGYGRQDADLDIKARWAASSFYGGPFALSVSTLFTLSTLTDNNIPFMLSKDLQIHYFSRGFYKTCSLTTK